MNNFNRSSIKRAILLIAGVIPLAILASCGSSGEEWPEPTATTASIEQPAPPATAAPWGTLEPTAIPSATSMYPPKPQLRGSGPKYGGIAVLATRDDPPGWDPMFTLTISLYSVSGSIYGRGNLVMGSVGNLFEAAPALASKWDSNDDFTQWIFTIRDGVEWHDGVSFTAKDAKFWLDLSLFPPEGRMRSWIHTILGDVKSVEVDENKVVVNLNKSTPVYLNQLINSPNYNIAHPPHLMKPEIDDGNVKVSPNQVDWIALGPFRMEKYVEGSVVRVRRFDGYWGRNPANLQLPFLDGIDFPIMTDPSSIVAAFRTGRLDGTAPGSGYFLTPESKAVIAKDLGDQVNFVEQPYLAWGVVPNAARSPWDDVRVREAVSLWFHRQEGIRSVHGGLAELSTWWSPNSPWVNEDFREWPGYNAATKDADRARAKELLAEAGYSNGFETTLLCRNKWIAWCEYTENQLSGLLGRNNVSIDVVDEATRIDRQCRGDFDISISVHTELFPEASAVRFVTTNRCSDVKNDPKLDEYFTRLAAMRFKVDQKNLSHEVERYVLQEKFYKTMLWYETASQAYVQRLKDVIIPAQGGKHHLAYDTAWLKPRASG
jgi:peptide/nickel transport system substrate-binding protein